LNTLTTLSFFGGIGLVVFVAMLSLLNIPCGLRLWGPSLGVAAACILVGAVLMDPERLKPNQGGTVPFTSYAAPLIPPERPRREGEAPAEPARGVAQRDASTARQEPRPLETLLWRPLVKTDQQGQASVRVELPAHPASCRILLDAHAGDGRIGASNSPLGCQMPFRLEPRVPAEVSVGDRIHVPVSITNASDQRLSVELALEYGPWVRMEGAPKRTRQMAPQERVEEYFTLDAVGPKGDCPLTFRAQSGGLASAVQQSVKVHPAGYPAELSYSGRIERREQITVRVPDEVLAGSLDAQLRLFPSLAADAQAAMEGLAQQPAGCFEQALALAGTAAIGLRELAADEPADPSLTRWAKQSLRAAQSTWSKCVSPGGGYDFFGADPAHEALTALAIWQFKETGKACRADSAASARATKWLLDRRDGAGGFVSRVSLAGQSAGIAKEIEDAYILWALSESGQTNLEGELKRAVELADKSDDPYRLALVAMAALNSGKKTEARRLLDKLAKLQAPDGHLAGTASTTASGGVSLAVETTALAARAWLELPEYASQADRAAGWILRQRNASGTFGAAQATLLALTALAADAQRIHPATGEGKCVIRRAGKEGRIGNPSSVVAERAIPARQHAVLTIAGLQDKLLPGDNRLEVELAGVNPLPYVLAIHYRTAKPPSDAACPVRLSAKLAQVKVKAGQAVPLEVQVVNATDRGLPMTVAVVGLPAGMEIRPERIEALRRSGALDAYEIRPRELVCYWRSFASKKTAIVQLDLAAAVPGRFTAPASRAYLNDTPERKHWIEPLTVEITRE
jgi:uncharacterized protein YfaS (alpha-2-macroglobulin family)